MKTFSSSNSQKCLIQCTILLTIHLIASSSFSYSQTQTDAYQYHLLESRKSFSAANVLLNTSALSFDFRNDYCLKELMYKQLTFNYLKNKNCGFVTLSHFGYSKYGLLSATAGYARTFSNQLSISMSGNYIAQHAEHYACIHSFTIDLSGIIQINNRIGLLVDIYNPIRMKYGITGKTIIPLQFHIQSYYLINPKTLLYLNCLKELPGQAEFGTGLCSQSLKHLYINGYCSSLRLSAGVDIVWKNLLIGTSVRWYYKLGISTLFNFHYLFNP